MLGRRVAVAIATISVLTGACSARPAIPQPSAGSSARPASVGPAASPATTPAPSLAPTPAPSFGPWRSAPDDAPIAGAQFQHVVWTGQRFVASGAGLDGTGAVLDSTDGLRWHRQKMDTADAYPGVLAVGPGGVVAIGRIGEHPASWSSADGLAWRVRPSAFPSTVAGGNIVSVTAVVATDDGWLAVGRADPPCNTNCGLDPVRAIVWTSTDGLDWARVADQASFASAGMTGVARGESGFIAVGLAGDHAAAWTSPDGAVWTRAADAPLFHAVRSPDPSLWTQMTGVAAGHGVVAAIGNEGPGGAHGPAGRAWWSLDGQTWTAATVEDFGAHGEISVYPADVIVTTTGFLAIAGTNGACTSQVWTSPDGADWRCSAADADLPPITPYAAAASATVQVVVGLLNQPEPGPDGFPGAVVLRRLP